MMISYEWLVEEIDEHGDIQDVRHHESAIDMLADVAREQASGHIVNYGLVRDAFDKTGFNYGRSWAYVKNRELSSMTFDAAGIEIASVPKRLISEFNNTIRMFYDIIAT